RPRRGEGLEPRLPPTPADAAAGGASHWDTCGYGLGLARSPTPASAHAEIPTPRGAALRPAAPWCGLSDADEPRGWRWGERALRGEDRRNSPSLPRRHSESCTAISGVKRERR